MIELLNRLVDLYNSFIQSDMVVGQNSVRMLNHKFRSVHYSFSPNQLQSSSNSSSNTVSVSVPQSNLEEYLESINQRASFPFFFSEE